jgi:SAM-dependent methyltransferase
VARERRLAFGEVAELYDRARPSYPAALVDDVLEFAGAEAGDLALEVGAGTGRATALFAERGLEIRALEPSPEMAAVALRNCAGYANLTIDQSDFEHWRAGGRASKLLFSAQAWHWVTPELRYVRAREALSPGGALAVFWNRPRWESCALRDELQEAYRDGAPDFGPGTGPGPMHPATQAVPELWGDWEGELRAAPGFGKPDIRVYRWGHRYETDEYVRLLQTHSDHILLPPEQRGALLGAVAGVIDRNGGTLELEYVTLLCLARAAAGSERPAG